MTYSIIAAVGKEREIGIGEKGRDKLPWHLPDDLRRFRQLTVGHSVIMGRKTFESIGRPLPDRQNIVVTRDENYQAEGCLVVHSLEEAFGLTADEEESFIIGGEQLYIQALPFANRMYITHVDTTVEEAQTFFPEFDKNDWRTVRSEDCPSDLLPTTFVVYERKKE